MLVSAFHAGSIPEIVCIRTTVVISDAVGAVNKPGSVQINVILRIGEPIVAVQKRELHILSVCL
jgi:hypothetical protein